MRRPEHAPWLLAAVGLACVLLGLRGPTRAEVHALGCRRVAWVEDALLCDAELDAVSACGGPRALRSGDALGPDCVPGRMRPDDLAHLAVAIDPNVDPASDLQSLPRIGPVLARRIVDGRPYDGPAALLQVKGIGPKTLARIRPRLSFRAPRPSGPR